MGSLCSQMHTALSCGQQKQRENIVSFLHTNWKKRTAEARRKRKAEKHRKSEIKEEEKRRMMIEIKTSVE